jgi:transglutaminase superfamily protein
MLTSRLAKARQLSSGDRRLLYRSLLLLPAIHVVLFVLGYTRLRTALERMVPPGKDVSELDPVDEAQRVAQIVSMAAGHGIYKATCLRRSLLLWWFLREEGIHSEICFGVRLVDQQLQAHAWVEIQEIVVNDSPEIRLWFQPLHSVLPTSEMRL